METDYRKLCVELFGTDDVNKLRALAAKNSRNAGRKKKYSEGDVARMRKLRADGVSVNEIAERFGTSRQIVSKYLNDAPAPGRTMRMTYMNGHSPCTEIDVDFLRQEVDIRNYTDDVLLRAFGVKERPSWEDFEDFLAYRCFPKTRGNAKDLLKGLGLSSYDPIQIVEKTRGRIADDDMWLRIKYYENA